ncbi:cation diffusion facilitator family transporter [Corynebacterium freneyi]|uniref:cation diffusion facilitator family transporter n=1 Tax=Corynebacterium freneyi TaxID=134034 RepID=UPI00254A5316|nr:cation diffusion facilitator family transporter [Corynebacterium freneyi]MDK8767749.1 cation diffusion facilitator family transporter [Corynebacterium freneyi]
MRDLSRFAWLSVAAAIVTIALKTTGYFVTGSVGLLSDAAESLVNLVAAVVALVVLKVIAKPADDDHEFGHSKAEYFSAGLEGAMILVASGFIIAASIGRLLDPQPIEQIGLGLILGVVASVVNLVVAIILIRAGRTHRSITLTADGKHLMTDVWTSAGVVVAVFLVWLTQWWWLDPVIALLVALNILITGYKLLMEAGGGLMDRAMDGADRADVDRILDSHRDPARSIDVHEIRTRVSGRQEFIEFHVLVPGKWSVEHGHDILHAMEDDLRDRFPGVHISSHLEPIEDERAYDDVDL